MKSIPVGQWRAVRSEVTAADIDPRNDEDVNPKFPKATPYEGATGYRALWEAWNSGVFAKTLGPCGSILYFGGGRDYLGNQVVALNVCGGSNGTPVWQRLSSPYPGTAALPNPLGRYADNTPIPPHTFDLLSFDSKNNSLVLAQSLGGDRSLANVPMAWAFDLGARAWRGPFKHRGATNGVSAFDTKRGLTWFQPEQNSPGELTSLDASRGSLRYFGWPKANGIGEAGSMMGYDPIRDRLVMTSFRSIPGVISERRLDLPNSPWVIAQQERAPARTWSQHAFVWSQSRKAWIVWMSNGGGQVYEVRYKGLNVKQAPVYVWSNLTAAANTTTPIKTGTIHNGSFDKFQLVNFDDGAEVLLGQLRLADGVFAFRLPDGPPVKLASTATSAIGVVPAASASVVANAAAAVARPMVPAPTLDTQLAALKPGHWSKVVADNLAADIDPSRDPASNPRYPATASYDGTVGFRGVWEAWNSGVFAATHGKCGSVLYFGGGHNDYWGNAVIALNLCGGKQGGPVWERLSTPYGGPINWPLTDGAFPDGTPAPPHTGDGLVFDKASNSLIVLQSLSSGPRATNAPNAWRFSLDTHQWSGPFPHRGAHSAASAYDERRNLLWFQPQQGYPGEFTSFEPATGKFSYYGWPFVSGVGNLGSSMGYDPLRDVMVATDFRTAPGTIAEHSLSNPASAWRIIPQHNAPAPIAGYQTFAWSPARKAWIVWIPALGATVYEVRFVNDANGGRYEWSALTAVDNSIVPLAVGTANNGSYDKFQIITTGAGAEVLIGQLRLQDGVFAFRIPAPGEQVVAVPINAPAPVAAPAPAAMPVPASSPSPAPAAPAPAPAPAVVTLPGRFSEPGWGNVCRQPGVFVCDNFGDPATLDGVMSGGDTMPRIENGELKFSIPSGSSANAGGEYRVTFPAIGEGQFLAFSYRVKADTAAMALSGRKEFILWRGASSCTDLELSQTHYYNTPLVLPYTACGAGNFYLPLGQFDYQLQFPDYNCTYHGIRSGFDGCAITHANEWENYYIEVQIGTYGAPNSRVVMWHKTDGGAWKRYVERNDFKFSGSGGFNQFMLTVYMTGKDPSIAHAPAEVVYDHLIMSTQPLTLDGLGGLP
ncbi:MAG: hypothetical protein IT492_23285 [Gammaproteobacteria bacterium]|nr:hypothetical protein [Gammaproteobacteria bacterium]